MTLAAFLLASILSAAAPPPMAGGSVAYSSAQSSAPSSTPAATPPQNTPAQQNQGTAPTANPSTTTKPTAAPQTPAQTPTVHKRPHRKKKPTNTNCVPATSAPSTADPANAASAQSQSDAQASGASAPATAADPTNCPPPKVIVRQGGTKEPSIQLVGGAGGSQAAQLRDTDNRILKSAEDNLAKLSGRTLDSNQQDMVHQIHQFVDEAKAAIAAGELERARTLASKAQQLSQDLVQPPK
jgi:hypothetical protein